MRGLVLGHPDDEWPDGGLRAPSMRTHLGIAVLGIAVALAGLLGGAATSLALFTGSATTTASFTAGTWATATTYDLHNNPTPPVGNTTAQFNLALDGTAPTAATLFNYDTNCDSNTGRQITRRASASPTEATTCFYGNWRTAPLTSARTLSGTASVVVYARKASPNGTDPTLVAYLRDFNQVGGTYVELANAGAVITTSSASPFAMSAISIPVSATVAIGHQVELKFVASGSNRNVDLAYDTTTYVSTLTLP